MASRYGITQPNGVKFTLLYDEEQSKADLQERLILKPWAGYCLDNWLSENHAQSYAPEHKVKRLLDRCGTLLLRDVPPGERGTLTSYKEMEVRRREINLSDCPEGLADMIESGDIRLNDLSKDDRARYELLVEQLGEKPRKIEKERHTTRFDRLEAIRRVHPGCRLDICRVDVDGGFECGDRHFQVDVAEGRYAAKKTRYGDQYDMDRIIGITQIDGSVRFADQDGYMLDDAMITMLKE